MVPLYRQKYFIDAALTSGCACPGDILTYECTVMGGLYEYTYWTGTAVALNCPYNEIVLPHYHFTETYQACNNGPIVARLISVEGNNYTSQLNVTVTHDIAGETIKCFYVNGRSTIQLSTVLPTTGLSPCIAS